MQAQSASRCCHVLCSEQPFSDPFHGFFAIRPLSESGQADISFTTGAEAYSRRAHYIGFIQHLFKEFPRVYLTRCLHPQVGGVLSAENFESCTFQRFFHDAGVSHIILYDGFHLLFALGGIDRFGTTLGDIGCAVELGALAAVPHPVQRNALSFQRGGCEFFRYDGVSATHPGESGRLRETAKFYRYFLRSFYLINGVRNVRVLYVGLVGSIVKDEGIISNA